jgi:hypothetical protein
VAAVDTAEFSDEPVTPLARWRRRTATGVVLTSIAIGLQEALESEKERPGIVHPAPTAPPTPNPVDVHLDPDHPEYTVAIVRPWLWH